MLKLKHFTQFKTKFSSRNVYCAHLVHNSAVAVTDAGLLCFLSIVPQLVPRHAIARHHRQVVPGVTLVVERRPDVDLSLVGVNREDVGVSGLR